MADTEFGTFQAFIEKERERLNAEREAIFSQQHELEAKLAEINREMAAISAYEDTKAGKAAPAARAPRATKATGATARGRKGSKRPEILKLLAEHPDGLGRGEILEKLGLKGDKSAEMPVSNALTAMIKANEVGRKGAGRGSKYVSA
jgi:hypothetical protein